jgi:hypothetical protein
MIIGAIGIAFDFWAIKSTLDTHIWLASLSPEQLIKLLVPNPDDWLKEELLKWIIFGIANSP